MKETVLEKLKVLAESAKYDVSCASSGVTRKHRAGGVGSAAGWGICHSFTADGRCVSLLKIMLTNVCIYDCAYCINRRSNDIPRAAFTPGELAELTIEFYRRNYIEGLFLSSGVVRDPDYTMERMVRVARDLRTVHRFNGYIHLKSIPGASRELVAEAGRYADRMSVNIEIPTERNLQLLAPDKNYESIYRPMSYIQQGVLQSAEERTRFRHAPRFAPAGQSTQDPLSPCADGAAAALLTSGDKAKEWNLTPMAELLGFAVAGCDPQRPQAAGSAAVKKCWPGMGWQSGISPALKSSKTARQTFWKRQELWAAARC